MGKRIVVTGVSRGLGRAICDVLAQSDHTMIGCARSEDGVSKLRNDIGPPHSFSVVDVSSVDQVDNWAQRVINKIGIPDLIWNNAGIINRNAKLWEVPPEEFQRICDVNLFGTFAIIRAFLPSMIEKRTGGIVNFSSGWGRSTSPEVAPYCATKWGIEGLTQAFASELPRDMFAVAMNPGVIHTRMLESCFGEASSSYPTPTEWARKAVPFMLSLGPDDNGSSVRAP